jgi:hypothetical protein
LSHAPSPFCFVIFEISSPLDCLPLSWGDRCRNQYPAFISWEGLVSFFSPTWPQTMVHLFSASQVSGITEVSHCSQWLWWFFFIHLLLWAIIHTKEWI